MSSIEYVISPDEEAMINSAAKNFEEKWKIPVLGGEHLAIFRIAFLLGRNSAVEDVKEGKTVEYTRNKEILIEDLKLQSRAYKVLRRAGFETADQVSRFSEEDFEYIRNAGKKVIEEIKNSLSKFGLHLADKTYYSVYERLEDVKKENYIRKYTEIINKLNGKSIDEIKMLKLDTIFKNEDIYAINRNYGINFTILNLLLLSKNEVKKSSDCRNEEIEVITTVLSKLGIDWLGIL